VALVRTSGTCSRLPTEPDPDAVVIGRVGRPHGLDGAFVVDGASADPARFEVGAELLAGGRLAVVTLSRRVGGGRRAIKLDLSVERGMELAVRRADLPQLEGDAYYVSDLVGLKVVDPEGAIVGTVRDIYQGPANDALELDSGLLLPLVEDCVREIDLASRRIFLNPGFTA
jgi:16S rRNA processing protein RimM